KQNRFATALSYHKLGVTYPVGEVQTSGAVTINGQPIDLHRETGAFSDAGMSVGSFKDPTGDLLSSAIGASIHVDGVNVESSHARIRINHEGQVFIKDTSTGGTYINGEKIGPEWREVFPGEMSSVTLGPPAPQLTVLRSESGEVKLNGHSLRADTISGINQKGEVQSGDLQVRLGENNKIQIRDISKDGTFVNGTRIERDQWVEISSRDKVTFGEQTEAGVVSDPESASRFQLGNSTTGKLTVNGKELSDNRPVVITDSGAVLGYDGATEALPALVEVNGAGEVFVRSNGEKDVYINGKPIKAGQWIKMEAADKVTIGPPPGKLDIQADVRLYRPDEFVNVQLDGTSAMMQAKNLSAWKLDSQSWHYGGIAAMALLDAAMIVSGAVTLKAASKVTLEAGAAKAGEMAAQKALQRMYMQGMKQIALGATGFMGQGIENLGEGGKWFMKARGLVMAYDVIMHGPVGDIKGLFSANKVADPASKWMNMYLYGAESAPAVTGWQRFVPFANTVRQAQGASEAGTLLRWGAHEFGVQTFYWANPYFLGEIAHNQLPLFDQWYFDKPDVGMLFQEGLILRGEQFQSGESSHPPAQASIADRVLRFMDDGARREVRTVREQSMAVAGFGTGGDADPIKGLEQLPENIAPDSPLGALISTVGEDRVSEAIKAAGSQGALTRIAGQVREQYREQLTGRYLDAANDRE
ncbi:MAG: FHA domain-containing protein, partial [Cyanobacteria bacterium]|nr:FHA domain-containing protein [Cyanobacteriota bacterium]